MRIFLSMVVASSLVGCSLPVEKLNPTIVYTPPAHQIEHLPSAFPPLSQEELDTPWGRELYLGNGFAKESDFYRAITCYRRALLLLPVEEIERQLQLDQDILTCYYLGGKYQEVLDVFETSPLTQVSPKYPGFRNLLLILYHSYLKLGLESKAEALLQKIDKLSPDTASDLALFRDLTKADLIHLDQQLSAHRNHAQIQSLFDTYRHQAKSPKTARILNGLLPGAGYFYIGQKKAAFTSFVINTLFIAASYQFFHVGYPFAGAITTGMEMGWYLGGINGAGLGAQEYNDRLYEGVAKKILIEQQSFPLMMWETSF